MWWLCCPRQEILPHPTLPMPAVLFEGLLLSSWPDPRPEDVAVPGGQAGGSQGVLRYWSLQQGRCMSALQRKSRAVGWPRRCKVCQGTCTHQRGQQIRSPQPVNVVHIPTEAVLLVAFVIWYCYFCNSYPHNQK